MRKSLKENQLMDQIPKSILEIDRGTVSHTGITMVAEGQSSMNEIEAKLSGKITVESTTEILNNLSKTRYEMNPTESSKLWSGPSTSSKIGS